MNDTPNEGNEKSRQWKCPTCFHTTDRHHNERQRPFCDRCESRDALLIEMKPVGPGSEKILTTTASDSETRNSMTTECPDCSHDLAGEPIENPFSGILGSNIQTQIKDNELVLCAKITCPECGWTDSRVWHGSSVKENQ